MAGGLVSWGAGSGFRWFVRWLVRWFVRSFDLLHGRSCDCLIFSILFCSFIVLYISCNQTTLSTNQQYQPTNIIIMFDGNHRSNRRPVNLSGRRRKATGRPPVSHRHDPDSTSSTLTGAHSWLNCISYFRIPFPMSAIHFLRYSFLPVTRLPDRPPARSVGCHDR